MRRAGAMLAAALMMTACTALCACGGGSETTPVAEQPVESAPAPSQAQSQARASASAERSIYSDDQLAGLRIASYISHDNFAADLNCRDMMNEIKSRETGLDQPFVDVANLGRIVYNHVVNAYEVDSAPDGFEPGDFTRFANMDEVDATVFLSAMDRDFPDCAARLRGAVEAYKAAGNLVLGEGDE